MYMLLYQGAEAFRLFTGQEMPIDVVREKYFSK
jgi:shikimate dehydrogenase